MSMEDVILVATVREEIRGGALRVNAPDISRHVELAQAGKPNCLMGNDVSWDGPKSATTWQESNSTLTSGIDPNVKVGGTRMIEVVSPPGDKFADSARAPSKVESTQALKTVPTEVVTDYKLSKDPDPAPSPAPADPLQTPSVSGQNPTSEKDTVAKEHNDTPELGASPPVEPSSGPKAQTFNALDAKASDTRAPTEAPPAIQEEIIEPDGTAIEPVLQPNQPGEAGDQRPTPPKGVAPSSPLQEEYQVALRSMLTMGKKRKKQKGRKQTQMDENKSLCPPSEATLDRVDSSVVQAPKPIATAPVDISVGAEEEVLVVVKTECSGNDVPVIEKKPDAAAEYNHGDVLDEWEW